MIGMCMSSASSSLSILSTSAGSLSSEQTVEGIGKTEMKRVKTKKNKKRGAQARANHEARKREKRSISYQTSSSSSSSSSPRISIFGYISGSYAASGSQLVQDVYSIYELVDATSSIDKFDKSDNSYVSTASSTDKFDKVDDSYVSGGFTKCEDFLEINSGPSWHHAEDKYLDTMVEQTEVVNNHWVISPGEVKELLQEKELTNKTTSEVASPIELIPGVNGVSQKSEITKVDENFGASPGVGPVQQTFRGFSGKTVVGCNLIEGATVENTTIEDIFNKENITKLDRQATDTPQKAVTGGIMDKSAGAIEAETATKSLTEPVDISAEGNSNYAVTRGVCDKIDENQVVVIEQTPNQSSRVIEGVAVISSPKELIEEGLGDFGTEEFLNSIDMACEENFKLTTGGLKEIAATISPLKAISLEIVDGATREIGEGSTQKKAKKRNRNRGPISRAAEKARRRERKAEMTGSHGPSSGFSSLYAVTGDQLTEQAYSLYDSADTSPTSSNHDDSHEAYEHSIYNTRRFTESCSIGLQDSFQGPSDSLADSDIESDLSRKIEDSCPKLLETLEALGSLDIDVALQKEVTEQDIVEPVILGGENETDFRNVIMLIKPKTGDKDIGEDIEEVTKEVESEAIDVLKDLNEVLIMESEKKNEIFVAQIIQEYNERIRALEAEISEKDSELRDLKQTMSMQQDENIERVVEAQTKVSKEIKNKERENAENAAKREPETAKKLEVLTQNFNYMQEQYVSGFANFEVEKMELQRKIDRIDKQSVSLQAEANANNELLRKSYKIVRDLKDHFKLLVQGSEAIGGGTVKMPLPTLSMMNSSIKELKQLMQMNEGIEYEQALARQGRSDAIDAALLRIDREKMAKDFASWETKCQKFPTRKPTIAAYVSTNSSPPAALITNVTKEDNSLINQVTVHAKTGFKKHGNKGKGKGKKSKAVATVDTPVFTDGIPEGNFEDGIRALFRRESPNFESFGGGIGKC